MVLRALIDVFHHMNAAKRTSNKLCTQVPISDWGVPQSNLITLVKFKVEECLFLALFSITLSHATNKKRMYFSVLFVGLSKWDNPTKKKIVFRTDLRRQTKFVYAGIFFLQKCQQRSFFFSQFCSLFGTFWHIHASVSFWRIFLGSLIHLYGFFSLTF